MAELDNDLMHRIYKEADSIMHSRVQSYMLAQTFLALSFSTLISGAGDNVFLMVAAIKVCALGWISSVMMRDKMLSVERRLRRFRTRMSKIPEFVLYYGEDIEDLVRDESAFVSRFPRLMQAAWFVFAIMARVIYIYGAVSF